MSQGNMSAWNDGPGDSRKYRNRAAIMSRVQMDGVHWVWAGERNFMGEPAFRLPSGLMESAHLVVREIFAGKREPTLTQTCDRKDCVKCWRRPTAKPRKAPPAPKSAPRKAPSPTPGPAAMEKVEPIPESAPKRKPGGQRGRYYKETCIRGHDLAVTRRRVGQTGNTYCAECVRERKQESRVRYSGSEYPVGRPMAIVCGNGHQGSWARHPDNSRYCMRCMSDRGKARKAAARGEAA